MTAPAGPHLLSSTRPRCKMPALEHCRDTGVSAPSLHHSSSFLTLSRPKMLLVPGPLRGGCFGLGGPPQIPLRGPGFSFWAWGFLHRSLYWGRYKKKGASFCKMQPGKRTGKGAESGSLGYGGFTFSSLRQRSMPSARRLALGKGMELGHTGSGERPAVAA